MKRIYIVLLMSLCFLLPEAVMGQGKSQFSFSYSPLSLNYWDKQKNGEKVTIVPGEYGYKAVGHERSYTGVFLLSYTYRLDEHLRLGMDIGYESIRRKWDVYTDPVGPKFVSQQIHSLQFLPEASYVYLSNTAVDIYSSVLIGMEYMWSGFRYALPKEESSVSLAGQLWLVGLDVKLKSFVLTGNVGFGSVGFCKVGIAYNL